MKTNQRDKKLIRAIKEFFLLKDRTKNELPPRQKLKPIQLSNPASKTELKKIMDRIRAKNLFNFCEKLSQIK